MQCFLCLKNFKNNNLKAHFISNHKGLLEKCPANMSFIAYYNKLEKQGDPDQIVKSEGKIEDKRVL